MLPETGLGCTLNKLVAVPNSNFHFGGRENGLTLLLYVLTWTNILILRLYLIPWLPDSHTHHVKAWGLQSLRFQNVVSSGSLYQVWGPVSPQLPPGGLQGQVADYIITLLWRGRHGLMLCWTAPYKHHSHPSFSLLSWTSVLDPTIKNVMSPQVCMYIFI